MYSWNVTPTKKKNETNSHFSYGVVTDKKKLWNAKRPKFLFGRCNWISIFSTTQSGLQNNTKATTCKVRFRLISTITNTIICSIRASLQSNTSNVNYGLNLGNIKVKKDVYTKTNYLKCNTLDIDGFTMIIPTIDSSILTLSIYDNNETLLTTLPNYSIWLYFDTIL